MPPRRFPLVCLLTVTIEMAIGDGMGSSGAAPKGSSATLLFLAFGAVVASFLATNIIVQRSSTAVKALSERIIENAGSSIELLASARRSVLEAELALSRLIHEPAVRPQMKRAMEDALDRGASDTYQYIALPPFAGEQDLIRSVQHAWLDFEVSVRRAADLASSNTTRANAVLGRTVEPARAVALDAIARAIELNAAHGSRLAAEIRETHRHSNRVANALTAISIALAALMGWLLHRQARARHDLFEAHSRSLEARAAELEQFSGRVAHDIRNPISTARIASELVLRKTSDESVRDTTVRIIRSLSRADAITTALLEFARSGAKPEPGARTDVRAVLADALAGVAQEAEHARVELRCEPVPPVLAACSEGVYLSLVGNLVRNAIKYMGNSAVRSVTVRVVEQTGIVRTEVVDSGPGIPAEALPSLFEPYFRAQRSGPDGLGLGLATVKKLAEGHGGRVGVSSIAGKGSTFWFELPRAGAAADAVSDLHHAPPQSDARH